MNDFIVNLCSKIGFSSDEIKILAENVGVLQGDSRLCGIKDEFLNNENYEVFKERLSELAAGTNIPSYLLNLCFLLLCSENLYEAYQKNSFKDEMFFELMKDLKYKNDECKMVYGEMGTFVFPWFYKHFHLKLFAIGRFQYEIIPFKLDLFCDKNFCIKKGDDVLSIHIPSSKIPLTKEVRHDSYQAATSFFSQFIKNPICFTCESWLLYGENENIFAKHSNAYEFFKDFSILSSTPGDFFEDGWRIFGKDYQKPFSELPQNTTMQRSFARWLLSGKKLGTGFGVFFLG